MSFIPLGDALKDRLKRNSPMQKQIDAAEVVEGAKLVFVELFGVELAQHANPLFLKNRTLTVSCTSSAMAQEIRLNQQQIVDKINKKVGGNEVDRIRYLS